MNSAVRKLLKDRAAELEKRDGALKPRELWLSAEDPDDPLHELFEWDDARCGELYRDEQARTYIRTITIEVVNDTVTMTAPMYVRDPDYAQDEQGYASIPELRKDEDRARSAVVYEFQRARSALERAQKVAAALDLQNEIRSIIEMIDVMRSKFDQPNH